ncbi:MAG: hypothetical protein MJD61_09585 [Proteobacteria bacterium]|nr:hypothetical protein [Pseudomonadota bacterium]
MDRIFVRSRAPGLVDSGTTAKKLGSNLRAVALVLALSACGDDAMDMPGGGAGSGEAGTGDAGMAGADAGGAGGGAGAGAATGCPPHPSVSMQGSACVISGDVMEDLTLTPDKNWLLKGGVFIGKDLGADPTSPSANGKAVTLTVRPGTTLFGDTRAFLAITRGSKIRAEGSKDSPIVMTSAQPDGMRKVGDWGGLIINGRAPLNVGLEVPGEGNTGLYGGMDEADDSGSLRYVRVEFAGDLISPENELNGIAFQGVGSGTEVDYVQVHRNADDGVEFFGGTVNVKHIVLSGIEDDSLDWTDGWTGKAQFVVAQQWSGVGDNGIEADNDSDNNKSTPYSNPVLSNITLIGVPDSSSSDLGILLREGTKGQIHNALVLGFNESCLSLDDLETLAHAKAGSLAIKNSVLSCSTNFKEPMKENATTMKKEPIDPANPKPTQDLFTKTGSGNQAVSDANSVLVDAFNTATPDFTPKTGSVVQVGGVKPSGGFFDSVDYIGAFGGEDWTQGWTAFPKN